MEPSIRKKQIIVFAAGGALTLALAAAHYLSPVSRRLAAGRDVGLVLLNKERPMLFVYHPFSRTINSVRLPGRTFSGTRSGGSAYQRACEVLKMFPHNWGQAQDAPGYIEVAAPDPDSLEALLNDWRSRPARLLTLCRYLVDLKTSESTNLSPYEMLLGALELVRLNSSNFIKEDFDKNLAAGRSQNEAPAAEPEQAGAVVRLEVLNASGRRDLAVLVTKYLRKQGFDVISFGTYGSVEERTKIVNCSDNIGAARKTREALGLGGREIYSKFSRLGIADARIILGSDFDAAILTRGMK
jgi:hypothetical protein